MAKKRQTPPSIGMRLTTDEKFILGAYAEAIGKEKGAVMHELIKHEIPRMAALIVRADIEKQIAKDPQAAAAWTPDLPDAAKDRQMRLDREARERKAAQKA
jgi:hypothetical protein